MRCVDPFISGKAAYPCGKCIPCLKYRARVWSHRILLESRCHGDNAFVTLTYADDRAEVAPREVQLFIKRLRKRSSPLRFRYFAVGEYGERSFRPHYHLALFGFPTCYGFIGKGECQCPSCLSVRETWGYGHVLVAPLEVRSAQYIAGYVTKKMTHRGDVRLNGRHPEFARMSLRPGIGVSAMWDVASETMRYELRAPFALRQGPIPRPLGRYLSGKLKEMVGEEKFQGIANEKILQIVREYAWNNNVSVKEAWRLGSSTGEVFAVKKGTI